MKNIILPLIIAALLSAETCFYKDPACIEGTHSSIFLINESDKRVNFHFYWYYPDTVIGPYNASRSGGKAVLLKGESFEKSAGPNGCCCWESNLANGGKDWVHIFDQDTISILDWEVVMRTQRGLLERRLIDLEYLQEHDFKIIYP